MPNLVSATGPKSAQIAFVGEAPGKEEDKERKPFVGPAGLLFDQICAEVGLLREDLYITNLVKYRPSENKIYPYYRECLTQEFDEWEKKGCLVAKVQKGWGKTGFRYFILTEEGMKAREELLKELNEIEAKVIVTLGASSTFALTGLAIITRVRGAPFESFLLAGKIILPTIHPAACLRQGKKDFSETELESDQTFKAGSPLYRFDIKEDFKRAIVIVEEGFSIPKPELVIDFDFNQVVNELEKIQDEKRPTAFDIERLFSGDIPCLSFSNSTNRAFSVPLTYSYWKDRSSLKSIKKIIKSVLEDPSFPKVAQNIMFDMFWLREEFGIEVRGKLEDTMIAHQIIFPELPADLGYLNARFTFNPFFKAEGKEAKATGDFKRYREYNAMDSISALGIHYNLEPLLIDEHRFIYEYTMELVPVLLKLERTGLKMNEESSLALQEELDKDIKEKTERVRELVFWPEFNPLSSEHAKLHFYNSLRIPAYIDRKSKKPTVDDEALSRLARGTMGRKGLEEASLIREIRQLSKLRGTYLKDNLSPDGRLMCLYKPRVTTGRLASLKGRKGTGTNHENIPERVKKFVIAD